MASGIITFTSDYGWEDEFVGVCHGVMLSITRDLRIVDLHHSIARHDVRHGAVVLEQSVPYMPDAVHLAVVDPSVGSERRAIAVETSCWWRTPTSTSPWRLTRVTRAPSCGPRRARR